MTASWLIGLVLVGPEPTPETEVATLVARLSAPRQADRDRAACRLEAIGDPAMPGLLKAVESRDLELRVRAAAVLDAIEGKALGRPTPVLLDFRDRPLVEVVDAIADRTGLGLILETQVDPRKADQKITLIAPAPIPFWDAIDRLGKVAGVRPDLNVNVGWNRGMMMGGFNGGGIGGAGNGPQPQPRRPRRPVTGQELALVPDLGGTPAPSLGSGRFQITVTNLHHQRDRTLGASGGRPPRESAFDRFEVRLRVIPEPEPELTVGKVGEVEGLVAEDDRGRSLAPISPFPDPPGGPTAFYDQHGGRASSVAIRLVYPDDPGQVIRRFKGTFPITIVGAKPDPIVASLVTGLDVPARKGDLTLTVHGVKPAPGAPRTRLVELTLSRPEMLVSSAYGYNPPMHQSRPMSYQPATAQGWFVFVDAEGRKLERVVATHFLNGDGQRRTIRVNQPDGLGPAVAVQYLSPTWTTLSVPFEFRDLPMP